MTTTKTKKRSASSGGSRGRTASKGGTKRSKPATIRTFKSAVKALLDRANVERTRPNRIPKDTFFLDRMTSLLEALDNPHQSVDAIHIAGSVGKGSTAAMLDSTLRGCGWAVGTFTSPHLLNVRERIMLNGTMISEEAFTDLTARVNKAALEAAPDATFFELITAMAFLHFAEEAVDMAVLETGLGGRLDTTNLCRPTVTLLSRIELDHMDLLGRDLASIAREKAGIMKADVPAFSVAQDPEVEAVLREVAEEVGTTLRILGKEVDFSSRFCVDDDRGAHARICFVGDHKQYMHLPVPLSGEHQAGNCGLAMAAIDHIGGTDPAFEESIVYQGLAQTTLPGRMQLAWDRPRILVDGAHNPASVSSLMRSIGSHVSFDSMICVFGCCEDKDIDGMLEMASLGGDKIVFTKASDQPRAAEPETLARRFTENHGRNCQTAASISEALEIAARAASRDDLICVTGSFYLVGETLEYLKQLEASRS
ncbi:MAG: bifunctional folylpolyglutamate synthase/dihydrofolate synthase [Phycisphaerales bacterium]|nr:bifunctional folylpolyglutamate synthase/dihydrofolate synthase [Phycisphaerales bacterium]